MHAGPAGLQWSAGLLRFGKNCSFASNQISFEQFNINVAIYGETEVEVAGRWAFSRGTYTLLMTHKTEGGTFSADGKWLDILKRQAGGSWKIYRDMVNYNAEPIIVE